MTLDLIVEQCRRSVAWLYKEGADRFGLDKNRIFIGGSSAGAISEGCC